MMGFLTLLADAVSLVFLFVMLSYYILIFLPDKKTAYIPKYRSLTIIVPAHNEGKRIRGCIRSLKRASFNGTKKIIIVDDGSTDDTATQARKELGKATVLITSRHRGKADSINEALRKANTDLVAVVDADSTISKNSLIELANSMPEGYGAATGIVTVKNRTKFIGMWLNIEQLYNSLIRKVMSKANANIVTPGPLSMYKRLALEKIGGFSNKGYSEDVDIAVRLIRKGYKIGFSDKSLSETIMPETFKGFVMQRARFAKGWINIFKKHLSLKKTIADLYSMPLALFFYLQAVIMSFVIIYNIAQGYFAYFYSKGIFFSFYVLKYFIDWLSIVGAVNWMANIINGSIPMTFFTVVSLASFLLTYPLYFLAIKKYSEKITWRHLIPIIFMTPYWLVIMVIYTLNIPEAFRKNQKNIWEKNE